MPVYDKPMHNYWLSLRITAGILDVLVSTTRQRVDHFGISITHASQLRPQGPAQASVD